MIVTRSERRQGKSGLALSRIRQDILKVAVGAVSDETFLGVGIGLDLDRLSEDEYFFNTVLF